MNELIPSIRCKNGAEHLHHSVTESKICWGVIPPPALPRTSAFTAGPSSLPPVEPPKMVTLAQLEYIEKLGGPGARQAATHLTRKSASALIDELKKQPKEAPVEPVKPDPKKAMVAGLLNMVPDGNYAVQEYDGGHVDFLRISRPKTGKYRGAIKVQTQHGSYGDGKYNDRAALWLNSGILSVYYQPITDMLLLLVADHLGAAMRYAVKSSRCCRCNAKLTDDRSRKYGIGPECEKLRPDVIEAVDMAEAMKS